MERHLDQGMCPSFFSWSSPRHPSQQLASAALSVLHRFKLTDSAPDRTFAKLPDFADLAHPQAVNFDHLSDLQREAGVSDSSQFLILHFCRHLGLKKLSLYPFKLDLHNGVPCSCAIRMWLPIISRYTHAGYIGAGYCSPRILESYF
jgi:hypothetical protein